MEVSKSGAGESAVSLSEAYRSVKLPGAGVGRWARPMAFFGPALLVSVGYMDPGNWATDLEGGSRFGYKLLWVILVSNLIAQLLQVMCARLGLATGKDLAMACRDYYPKPVAYALWILCEIAIIATDLAEVIGSAVALKLLFGIPLAWGVIITGFDVLLLLAFMHYGFRKIEAIIATLVLTIGCCFALNIFLAKPDWGGVASGLVVPALPGIDAVLIAVGIIGATVMPHNLYLHTSIVQTREIERTEDGIKEAIKFNTLDTVVALSLAFFVNAAILVLAAAAFHGSGEPVNDLAKAHEMLQPLLGGAAATAFAIALLCSGQSSTITGTLAGQIVMEGFLKVRVKPWIRRLVTRLLAIVPAIVLITARGGSGTTDLLVLSQVVLSMQLSFAAFPLVMFTSNRVKMGSHVNPLWMTVIGYLSCALIAGLNIYLLVEKLNPILLGGFVAGGVVFALWVKYGYKEKLAAA